MAVILDRRDFLTLGGILSGLVATGGPLTLVAPEAQAAEWLALDATQARTLLSVMQTIAPHDGLPDEAYLLASRAIDSVLVPDAGARTLVRTGIDALGADFASLSETARVDRLQAVEDTPFFKFVRVQTLVNLYASPVAYRHFGYEGEAFSKGGYLTRGFDQLDWLPDVPLEAAGPNPARSA